MIGPLVVPMSRALAAPTLGGLLGSFGPPPPPPATFTVYGVAHTVYGINFTIYGA